MGSLFKKNNKPLTQLGIYYGQCNIWVPVSLIVQSAGVVVAALSPALCGVYSQQIMLPHGRCFVQRITHTRLLTPCQQKLFLLLYNTIKSFNVKTDTKLWSIFWTDLLNWITIIHRRDKHKRRRYSKGYVNDCINIIVK